MSEDGEFPEEELLTALASLAWQPITTYSASDDDVLLRVGEEVKLGRGQDGDWLQVFDGDMVAVDGFDPEEWAVPTESLELAFRRW